MEKYYTTKELSEGYRISVWAIYKGIHDGSLQSVKIGKTYHITRPDFEAWMNKYLTSAKKEVKLSFPDAVVCTKFKCVVDWLRNKGIDGPVYERARMTDIRGKVVFGFVPMHLACLAKDLYFVEIPVVPSNTLDKLDVADLEALGAKITHYRVFKIED